MNSRDAVQPRDAAPVPEAECDLIGRVRTHKDDVVGRNQPHARVEVALSQFRESLSEPFRLPGNELERMASVPTGNPSYPFKTECAVAIVNEGRLWRYGVYYVPFHSAHVRYYDLNAHPVVDLTHIVLHPLADSPGLQ